MKNKVLTLLILLAFALGTSYQVSAQKKSKEDRASGKSKTGIKVKNEKSFVKFSDEALSIMEKKADELSIKGVAIVGFIPGDKTISWVTKMKVVGMLSNAKINYLAIAYTKASDMAVTLQNSGADKTRTILQGELGYQGGLIKKIKTGYIIAVFSGGSSAQDLQVSQEGLNAL